MSPFYRTCAAAGLVLAAVLSALWTSLEPAFPSGYADRLAAVEDGGTTALVSAILFAASQLPMLAAILGLGHLARPASPRLATAGTLLGVIGALGHAVVGGVSIVTVEMAQDSAHRDVQAALLESVEGSAGFIPFAAAGLLGTVLGLLLLSIALFRTRVVPRWAAALVWLFLVLEFAGGALSDWAMHAATVCLVVAFTALAAAVHRSPRELWEPADALGGRARLATWSSPTAS